MLQKIVVAQPIHSSVASLLRPYGELWINPGPEPLSSADLADHCADADAVMAFMTERIDETFLSRCPSLRIVAGALKGYNNLDVEACSQRGVYVTVVPDLLTEPTAELTVGMMIAVARNLTAGDRYVRSGEFHGWRPRFFGGSLCEANVTIIGAGAVGQTVMRMLSGFGCKLTYVDKKPLTPELEAKFDCKKSELSEALPQADFVVLAIHLMADTHHLVDDAFLNLMKPGSYLINPARGSVVDEAAVTRALQSEHLAGYAADTFEMEDWALEDRPDGVAEVLRTSDQTVLTPHIGSAVRRVREEIELSAARSIIDVAEGRLPSGVVNSHVKSTN
ncbi:MAG: NAD(P)-dependent oxidoreductase [Filomicrobium sp.]